MICSKAGSRDKCKGCMHSVEHIYNHNRGCDNGTCYPPILDENGMNRVQNYPCIEKETVITTEIMEVKET